MGAFETGHASALVASDVAARGIHVDGVAAVVHYDPPADADAYVHRSGRTGRAGCIGIVVSFIDPTADTTSALHRRLDLGMKTDPIDLAPPIQSNNYSITRIA